MSTGTDEAVDTSTTTTDAELEQRESEEGFAAGFTKIAGKPAEEPNAEQQATEKSAAELKAEADAKAASEAEARAAQEAEAREKAWDGVPAIVRERLEKLESIPGSIDKLAGHVGGFKRQLDSALATAKAAAIEKGSAAPTDSQVTQAKADASGELWKQMQEDFPDWAKAVDERLAAIGKPGVAADAETLKREVAQSVAPLVQEAIGSARELARLDLKHEGWEDTIQTQEFRAYALEGGPTAEAYARMKSLEGTDPAKAVEIRKGFQAEFPEWWKSKGAAIFSESAKDAITLLDGFTAHKQKAADADAQRLRREKRLQGAVTVQGTNTPHKVGINDEEAFARGFKRARGT